MEVWAILIDYAKDDSRDEMILEDKFYFAGLNEQTVLDQFKGIVENFEKVVHKQLEIDCDSWSFRTAKYPYDYDEVVLKVRLTEWSVKGDRETYLFFKLILLDLYDTCTLQTGIPKEYIEKIRKKVAEYFPHDSY